jgi:hypothetical protein
VVPSENFRLEKSDGFRILSTIIWSFTRMTVSMHSITFAPLFFISVSNLRHWTEPSVGFQIWIVDNSLSIYLATLLFKPQNSEGQGILKFYNFNFTVASWLLGNVCQAWCPLKNLFQRTVRGGGEAKPPQIPPLTTVLMNHRASSLRFII